MDLHKRIREHFADNIELNMQCMEGLIPKITDSARVMTQALLEEKRIFACGDACSTALAHYFSKLLILRYDRERPALPAFTLEPDLESLAAGNITESNEQTLVRQLKAHGQTGDVLLVITPFAGKLPGLLHFLKSAHSRAMKIILLTGENSSLDDFPWQENDIEICIPSSVPPRIQELNLLLLHSLCDLIDVQLFGAE